MLDLVGFGSLIKSYRGRKRLTQATLALDVFGDEQRKADISRIENGKAGTPQEATIQKLKAKLDIPQDAIDALRSEAVVNDAYIDALRARAVNLADSLHLTHALVTEVARRNAIASYDNFDAALTGIEEALRVTAADRAKPPSNLGGAMDQVFAQVNALNDTGDLEGGTRALKAAIAAQKDQLAEEEQGYAALLTKGIAQAVLERSVPDAVAFTLERLARDVPDRAERFAALRTEQKVWYERGRNLGLGFDLEVSVALADASLTMAQGPDQRGTAGNDLGNALSTLGERESGTEHLEAAVMAFEIALQERTRERVPMQWAMTQNNLGTVLQELGVRDSGTLRLEQAMAAYEAALQERTRDRVPLDWAMTQNNLGGTLSTLGERGSGSELLELAVAAFEAALQERTRERVPLDWAMTQNNLGAAFSVLGARESGTGRLGQAVVAFELALLEYTRERVPLDWSMTQNNLANALRMLGERESKTERLEKAVVAFNAGLIERTPERVPLNWAASKYNVALAELALARDATTADPGPHLDRALAHVTAALEVYDPVQMPYQYRQAVQLRDEVVAALAGG